MISLSTQTFPESGKGMVSQRFPRAAERRDQFGGLKPQLRHVGLMNVLWRYNKSGMLSEQI